MSRIIHGAEQLIEFGTLKYVASCHPNFQRTEHVNKQIVQRTMLQESLLGLRP